MKARFKLPERLLFYHLHQKSLANDSIALATEEKSCVCEMCQSHKLIHSYIRDVCLPLYPSYIKVTSHNDHYDPSLSKLSHKVLCLLDSVVQYLSLIDLPSLIICYIHNVSYLYSAIYIDSFSSKNRNVKLNSI